MEAILARKISLGEGTARHEFTIPLEDLVHAEREDVVMLYYNPVSCFLERYNQDVHFDPAKIHQNVTFKVYHCDIPGVNTKDVVFEFSDPKSNYWMFFIGKDLESILQVTRTCQMGATPETLYHCIVEGFKNHVISASF